MREILGDSEYGVIVPIEVCAIADAIQKMACDTEHRLYYEEKARERAAYFEPENAFKDIEELL